MSEPPPATHTTRSPGDTLALGRRLGRAARPGDVLALTGDLGAGKTVLTKGIAAGLDIDPDDVTSPTFVLMKQHHGRLALFHFDAYRLGSAGEILDIGAEETFDAGGVSVVEWADRVAGALPSDRVDILLEVAAETTRRITLAARGPTARALLTALASTP